MARYKLTLVVVTDDSLEDLKKPLYMEFGKGLTGTVIVCDDETYDEQMHESAQADWSGPDGYVLTQDVEEVER